MPKRATRPHLTSNIQLFHTGSCTPLHHSTDLIDYTFITRDTLLSGIILPIFATPPPHSHADDPLWRRPPRVNFVIPYSVATYFCLFSSHFNYRPHEIDGGCCRTCCHLPWPTPPTRGNVVLPPLPPPPSPRPPPPRPPCDLLPAQANAGGQGGPKKPILTGKKPEVKMMEYKINARLPRAEKTRMPMNIVFISTEVAPWSKTGGLGDVVGALPIELARRGHNVMTISPRYDQYYDAWDTSRSIDICGQRVGFFHTFDMGVNRIWVDHPLFLAKVNGVTGSQLYGTKAGADYKDNQLRFRIFCQAAIEATRCLPMSPGEDVMFVANDWHSALVPVMLKHIYQPSGQFKRAKSAICIHNIAFQGRFWADSFKELQLPESARGPFQFTDGWRVRLYTSI